MGQLGSRAERGLRTPPVDAPGGLSASLGPLSPGFGWGWPDFVAQAGSLHSVWSVSVLCVVGSRQVGRQEEGHKLNEAHTPKLNL